MDINLSFLLASVLFLTIQVASINGDFLPGRHIKIRGSKRPSRFPPVRVYHINPPSFKYPARKKPPSAPFPVFNPSPPAHYITPIITDINEGAIHTIPAPNLGPSRPQAAIVSSIATNHHGYEVHEAQEQHSLNKKPNTLFAPDPDPSIPAPHVPVTRDPQSQPSNGRAPFDLLLQQHLENQRVGQSAVSYTDSNSQFLQAFQDQYKFVKPYYDGEFQPSEQKVVSVVAPDDIQDDDDDDDIIDSEEEHIVSYGQKINPIRN